MRKLLTIGNAIVKSNTPGKTLVLPLPPDSLTFKTVADSDVPSSQTGSPQTGSVWGPGPFWAVPV